MNIKKVLIVSDSHQNTYNVLRAIDKEKPFELLVHLGDLEDSTHEIEAAAGLGCSCYFVRGNCDTGLELPVFTEFYLGPHHVFAAHGNRYHVHFGTEEIERSAKMYDCDVVMFGHTHVPLIKEKKEMLLLNPGSISLPRQSGREKTYIVLRAGEKGMLIPELKHL